MTSSYILNEEARIEGNRRMMKDKLDKLWLAVSLLDPPKGGLIHSPSERELAWYEGYRQAIADCLNAIERVKT